MRPAARIGSIVRVPVRGRSLPGCIVGISDEKKCASPKDIETLLTPEFTIAPDLIELACWISDYYFCSLGEALSCVSFIGFNDCRERRERWVRIKNPAALEKPETLNALPRRQADVMRHFIAQKIEAEKFPVLLHALSVSSSVVKSLEKKGLVEIIESVVERRDEYPVATVTTPPFTLNEHQSAAFEPIKGAIHKGRYEAFLLYGVTGSGKTEIYLQALGDVIKHARQGIVLVPEIALTPQTVERFRNRFGDQIGVYHSHLTLGQKFDLWRAIKSGRIKCLVGARSAVFAPFPALGIIVVDEEHESTYKQNDTPRYHARDVAIMRASRTGAVAILGSATPSLEAFHNARLGKYKLLTLPERIKQIPMPSVELMDMGRELTEEKNPGIFSRRLEDAIRKRLDAGEQVILFLNRRGFSNFLMCPACNKVIKCEHCDVTMTYHRVGERLVCHYCGATKPVPDICPYCGKEGLMRLGAGTQRLEEELAKKFPDASVLRLDSDTLGSRKAFIKKWHAITNGEVDILFGTQILAKGLDLEPVTLVGVISADFSLFLPDFRSAERTFSLLTQVAGRAGRGKRRGEVIIQTYLPKHYSIVDALAQDYTVFAERELKNRKALRFPPYYKLISVLFSGKKPKIISERIQRFANLLRVFRNQFGLREITILGPAPSPIGKLGDRYRYRLLMRGEKISEMQKVLRAGLEKFKSLKLKGGYRITIDVDPQDLL